MIEGSGSGPREGSGSGSKPLTNGSGSGRHKNTWIRIRIREHFHIQYGRFKYSEAYGTQQGCIEPLYASAGKEYGVITVGHRYVYCKGLPSYKRRSAKSKALRASSPFLQLVGTDGMTHFCSENGGICEIWFGE